MSGLEAAGVSRYMNSFIPQQPQGSQQQQQPGSSFLQPQPAPPGSMFPSGYNSGRGLQQPMNNQYNRPQGQPNVALQRNNSAGSVGHRGGLNSLGGSNSIGGLGGQLSVGLSMAPNRGAPSLSGQHNRGSMGPGAGLSVGGRSGSAPTYGSSGYGGSGLAPMPGMQGDGEMMPDMSAPSFGAEDFPTLGGTHMGAARMQQDMQPSMSSLAAQKVAQDSHFQMANEDFPALAPGASNKSMDGRAKEQQADVGGFSAAPGPSHQSGNQAGGKSMQPMQQQQQQADGTGASPYGLLGLLNVIQMTSADLNTLALGTDLTTLGLNLNSTEPLYTSFASPWADTPCRREPDFALPHCYYMQPPTLKTGHIQKFQLETLFYIFYMLPKDTLQAVAASELHARDWKFHSELGMWFCKQPESGKGGFGRASTFVYFDVKVWERRTYVDNSKNLEQGFLGEEEVMVQFGGHK